MAQRKVKGNCCPKCTKTHEECADGKTCEKWQISLSVCEVFGTRPHPLPPRRRSK
jgi:hypothetical protein